MKAFSTWICSGVLFLAISFCGNDSFAQISLSQTTINNYVANICGTGVTYSNVTLTGDAGAVANFVGGVSGGLGSTMNAGVVMSTGYVNTTNALTGTGLKDGDNSGGSISQLTSIAGASTYDGIILEFDFIPITTQIDVNFQFGSEEYNWYVESGYNDAFAFFISGPGISGSQNIAVVPSTTTPVTINSINNGYNATWLGNNACSVGPCTNCSYYNDNCSNTFNNAMNGFTTVLTASQVVVPCQTYHIKLMLADGGDAALDSWVFIQQDGLFSVGNPPLSLVATYPFGTALYEECTSTNTISFTIPSPQPADYTFNVTWGGTATNGTDYSTLPTSITIPAGQTTVNIPVDVYSDGLTEGVETIICTYPISVCSNGTATINIDDSAPLTVDAGTSLPFCQGTTSVTLTATPANANGSVTYVWDNGAGNTQSVSVSPLTTTTYTVTATDQCGRTDSDQVLVTVSPLPVVDAGSPQSVCPGSSVTLNGSGAVTYTWDNGGVDGVPFTPSSTATYTVTGTNAAGCQSTDQVVVTVYPLPTVDAGSPQTVCQGASVTLSGSGATSYSWNNGGVDGVSFVPASTTTYTVTGTDANGCQNTDQVTVTVNVLPTVDAGPNQSVCNSSPVTLNGSGATTYSWDNGVTNGVSFTPVTTTTYTVTGTDGNGCQNTDQVTVSVGALPVVDAGPNQSVCNGGTITLNGSGASTYSWDNGVTNGVAFTPGSTTTYTVTGTNAAGCQNTDQVIVTVNALPAVDAGLPQAVCPSTPVTLNGSGAVSYTWNNGITNGTPFTPVSTTTYTVTGTDANGCQNTDQVTVTVNPLPNVDAGSSQSVCNGGSVTLNGSGAISYSWNNSVTNGTPFTPASTTTYTVTGTDGNGCQNTDQVIVTVNPLPNVGAGGDQNICVGTSVTLSGTGAVTYVWSNGVVNNNPFTPGIGSITYTVTGTDANGCVNTDQVTVNVVTLPIADVYSSSTLSGYPGLSVTFENGSQNANAYAIDFGNGQTGSSTVLSDTYTSTYNAPGLYEVVLTASNGICQDTAMMQVLVNPYQPLVIHVPNVFTPDGDGVNDEFYIDVENGAEINVMIVNRWDNKMFEINDFTTHWDGKVNGNEATNGTYFFMYSVKGLDGSTQSGQGFVELFRK